MLLKLLHYVSNALFPVMNAALDETETYLYVQPSTGLSSAEAAFRLQRFGRNEEPIRTPSLLTRLSSLLPGHHRAHTTRRYATVCRDGSWVHLEEALLVPGDLVQLETGSFVPADCMLNPSDIPSSLLVDESAMTGEILPVSYKARQRLRWVRWSYSAQVFFPDVAFFPALH